VGKEGKKSGEVRKGEGKKEPEECPQKQTPNPGYA